MCCVLCHSFGTTHSLCAAVLPRAASPSLAPPPSHFSHLPVWPTIRSSWPSPCSVSESRSVGQSGCLWRAPLPWCVGKQGPGFPQISLSCCSSRCSSVGGAADGLLLFGGGPVGHRHHSGVLRACGWFRQRVRQDGAALAEGHRLKHRTHLEFSGSQGRPRLVVLAAEVGGRWWEEARSFVSQLARAKERSLLRVLRGCARQAWQYRWSAVLSFATSRSFALSLLDRRAAFGCDGDTSHGFGRCSRLPSPD